MLINQSILCWNCRGARSDEFIRELKDFRRLHRLVMIILTEPKISREGADEVCRKLGMMHWSHSDAEGFSGGT